MGALEVVKILTGVGTPMFGRLATFDLSDHSFHKLKLQRNPDCPVCGT